MKRIKSSAATSPRAVFDDAAAGYDREFTRTAIARLLRAAVWARLDAHFSAGMHVLELGCGTGEDALHLAQRGVRVLATDASPAMLAQTRTKAAHAGVGDLIQTARLDMSAPQLLTRSDSAVAASPGQQAGSGWQAAFDGVLSDFGALNCLTDVQPLCMQLASWTKPGARLMLVAMGPFCPWEIVWHLAHAQPRRAFRRWTPGGTLAHVGAQTVRVRYPSPRYLAAAFAPEFRLRQTRGLGVFLPPPYVQTQSRHTAASGLDGNPPSAVYRLLSALERRIDRFWPINQCGDHYILELERR